MKPTARHFPQSGPRRLRLVLVAALGTILASAPPGATAHEPSESHARIISTVGSKSGPGVLRKAIVTSLGIDPSVKSSLIDGVVDEISTPGTSWAHRHISGVDIWGDDYENQTIKSFSVLIGREGLTVTCNFSFDPKTGQLILAETRTYARPIDEGVKESEEMSDNPEYVKISESKNHALFNTKGYNIDTMYVVNETADTMIITTSVIYKEVHGK